MLCIVLGLIPVPEIAQSYEVNLAR
jgi:hypothetical protein